MSRTWKDQPLRVLRMKNMEKGLVDHDHRELPIRTWESYYPDRNLSVTYYKWAQAEINEHKALLDSLGSAITYTVVEHDNQYYPDPTRSWEDRIHAARPTFTLKTVEFAVKRLHSYEPQQYCTDAEHYDAHTNTDTRNGKRVRCEPHGPDRRRSLERYEVTDAAVKAELQRVRFHANSKEGLDPHYSSTVLEERWGKKVWIWND